MAPPTSSSGLSRERDEAERIRERHSALLTRSAVKSHFFRNTLEKIRWHNVKSMREKSSFWFSSDRYHKSVTFVITSGSSLSRKKKKKKKGIKLDLFPSVLWYRADAVHSQDGSKKKKHLGSALRGIQLFAARDRVNVGLWEWPHLAFSEHATALTVVAAGLDHWSKSRMFEMEKINHKQKGYQIVWNLII